MYVVHCRACSFGRRPRPAKKRKSCENLVDLEAWAAAEQVGKMDGRQSGESPGVQRSP